MSKEEAFENWWEDNHRDFHFYLREERWDEAAKKAFFAAFEIGYEEGIK